MIGMALLLSATVLHGQRIERVEGSRFETEAIVQDLTDFPFESLSFTSSAYIGGTLAIKSADLPAPRLTFRKILKAGSTAQAEDFSKYISVKIEELESELSISVEASARPPWSGTDYAGQIDLLLEIPGRETLKVYSRTTAYSIDIAGPFASVDVTNEMGHIQIANITRKVKVSSENSAVRIENCVGPVTVRTSLRPIVISDIDSKLGTVNLRNTNGTITMESIRGEIDVRTDFAAIQGDKLVIAAGRSKVRTENSNIKLRIADLQGDLLLTDAHGKIDLTIPENASARYGLQVEEGGRIYTSGIPIRADLVSRTRLSGSSGEGKNELNVDMRGVGTINLVGQTPDAP